MNEDSVVKEAPRKKRRSLWWLWLLLLLAAFGGGIILGLKLNTLPLPNEVKDRLYPVLESYIPGSTAGRDATAIPAPAPVPEVTAEPAPMPAPEPIAEPIPEEIAAPAVEETAVPERALTIEETAAAAAVETAAAFNASEPAADDSGKAAAEKKYVGVGAALETALSHAKVEEKDAEVSGVQRAKDEDGNTVYNVSFQSGEFSYEYVIDAVSGDVESWIKSGFSYMESMTYAASFAGEDMTEAEAAETVQEASPAEAAQEPAAAEPAQKPAGAEPARERIDEERAKEIAFEHADVKPEAVKYSGAHLEIDHGVEYYDVDFMTANRRFEYEIDAYTGEILGFEQNN